MDEIEKLAASLTRTQKRAVLGKTRWLRSDEAFEWPFGGTVRRMEEAPHKWEATPLGLELRDYLLANGRP